ncbi:MAG: hypothetical protein DRM97_02845 [Thermoprotei archaeon]|nr:MAG: hypothetical protein DRM97_02845 [Thermoprotei archaeon]
MSESLGFDELGINVKSYVERFKRELLRRFGDEVRSIVVFGSRARGRWKPWSDVDVIVVLKRAPKGLARVLSMPYAPLVEPWVYDENEFYEAMRRFDVAVLDALEHGIVIHDDGFWKEARRFFKEFKREWDLVEVEEGWVSRRLERKSLRESARSESN